MAPPPPTSFATFWVVAYRIAVVALLAWIAYRVSKPVDVQSLPWVDVKSPITVKQI